MLITDAAAALVASASASADVIGTTKVTSGSGDVVTSGHWDRYQVTINNPTGYGMVYLGGSAATSTIGYPLAAGTTITLTLPAGEAIYGRCSTGGSSELRVLVVGD